MPADASPESLANFETAMQRLEAIVREMDSPTLPLDQLVVKYEEGVQLVKTCELKLKDAQQKIEIITRRAQGKPELAEFEPEIKAAETTRARKDVKLF